ncbi:MAG: hypothetical protein GY810_28855 [Aureispira sp.]|nr:hypothetical protein [Aureispira sp.]
MKYIPLVLLYFLVACNTTTENTTNTNTTPTDTVATTPKPDTTATPTESIVAMEGGRVIPVLGQFDLAQMTQASSNEYGGGDCFAKATKYTLAQTVLVTDSMSCGEYGSTYTHYLLDANDKILAIYIHSPKMHFNDDSDQMTFRVLEQTIDFRTEPISTTERIANFTNSSEAVPNTNPFEDKALTETPSDYAHWEKTYKEIWTATVEED